MRMFRWLTKLWALPWMRIPLIALGVVSICAAIWFGLAMTGVGWLMSPWLRGGLIVLILGSIATFYGLRWRRRRAAAAELEENLIDVPVGDGEVLAERMRDAITRLKKSGGQTYLYDLPWYVIIGPPGAGKTTALVHSGLEFPGTDASAVAGFGGTKNCDFWFAEEAVMIDTAGRYTTQDSDARADKMSWAAFLDHLKRSRPDQPINGVILAFSCEDMMTATDDTLTAHALAVRARLAELHETLKIQVPVYTIFTKADMIAGFREYFGPYNEDRRRAVWGITFQTKDRKEETFRAVGPEFDKLISRLSDEVTDRLNEEPDSVARIAIFGFPGQMALMQRNVTDFLRRVFQKSGETGAILRGFYFTSGTQEGTPIDQVLGAMADTQDGLQPAFMSGKGRSYFLHDLLKQVIFAERDWVGFDFKAMRRRAVLRSVTVAAIGAATFGAMGLFGYAYWQNATLVAQADAKQREYAVVAQDLLEETTISDSATRPLLEVLRLVREIPGGYGAPVEQTWWQHMGLSRVRGLSTAANVAYSDALERLLRPRMMLHLENRLPQLVQTENYEEAYRALKVYILLAKEQGGREDDLAIQSYFAELWGPEYSEPGLDDDYIAINEHLAAMLELDERAEIAIGAKREIVEAVQKEIAVLSLAQQAYTSILSEGASLEPLRLPDVLGDVQADVVFRTTDNRPLDSLEVPGLFTFTGYWEVFDAAVKTAATRLEDERWVLGTAADAINYEGQLDGLSRDLHAIYARDFREAWDTMLDRIDLFPMSSGDTDYAALAVASAPFASPLTKLAEAVDQETRLTALLDAVESIELPADGEDVGGQLADFGFDEAERRSGALNRLIINMARDRTKFQGRANASPTAPTQRRMLEEIERPFERWHAIVKPQGQGTQSRAIDGLTASLKKLLDNRQLAGSGSTAAIDQRGLQDALNELNLGVRIYPETMIGFVNQIEREFLTVSANANMEELGRALTEEVALFCTQNIRPNFPINRRGSRPVSTSAFGDFFGYGGRMDEFYRTYLRDLTERAPDGSLRPREGSALGARLNEGTLREFVRAENIRQAFFETGSARPKVTFSITQVSQSDGVDGADVSFGERSVQLLRNASGPRVTWPDQTADITITLLPQRNRVENTLRFGGGTWAIMGFISQGQNEVSGTRVDVTHQVGGRAAKFRLEFDSTTVPFLMRELSQFSCPTTLE